MSMVQVKSDNLVQSTTDNKELLGEDQLHIGRQKTEEESSKCFDEKYKYM